MLSETTDATFDTDVLQSGVPVIVDYYADWCGPCKMMAPVLAELAADYGDKLKIIKHNIETDPQAPVTYGVRALPTLIMFKDGQMVSQHVGTISKTQFSAWVNETLGGLTAMPPAPYPKGPAL